MGENAPARQYVPIKNASTYMFAIVQSTDKEVMSNVNHGAILPRAL